MQVGNVLMKVEIARRFSLSGMFGNKIDGNKQPRDNGLELFKIHYFPTDCVYNCTASPYIFLGLQDPLFTLEVSLVAACMFWKIASPV